MLLARPIVSRDNIRFPATIREPMPTPLNIHPELQSIEVHTMPTNRWALAAMQNLLSAVNAIHRRKFKPLITRTKIASSDSFPVPILIIRPEKLRSPAPALVYYHGGAFVMKPAPQHFENALRYAREADCLVIFVEYRLAPKYPFPAGFNDCHAALRLGDLKCGDLRHRQGAPRGGWR